MQTSNRTIIQIEKELLHGMRFSNEDILSLDSSKADRKKKLLNALQLGNLFKCHVRLHIVEENSRIYETEATIWAVTEKHVILKNHLTIPIHTIRDVILH